MPIYEYRCMNCDKEFEYLVFGNDPSVTCPDCNKTKVERLISACSFKSSGNFFAAGASSAGASSGCASCSSGNCSTCH